MIFLVIFIIAILGIAVLFIIDLVNKNELYTLSKQGNLIVFGKKRKGKDLIFNAIINKNKNKVYSNIQFNKDKCDILELHDTNLNLTYKEFIEDKIEKINVEDIKFESFRDYFLSDGGIYLPSQEQGTLCKEYKSLPILYALSSQVFKMNIHVNTQSLNRVWDKLREQADTYIKALKTIKIGSFFITKYRLYDKYQSAENDLRVYPTHLFTSKESKAQEENYYAMHGLIKECFIIQHKNNIKYDTNAFRKIIINEKEEKYIDFKKGVNE